MDLTSKVSLPTSHSWFPLMIPDSAVRPPTFTWTQATSSLSLVPPQPASSEIGTLHSYPLHTVHTHPSNILPPAQAGPDSAPNFPAEEGASQRLNVIQVTAAP